MNFNSAGTEVFAAFHSNSRFDSISKQICSLFSDLYKTLEGTKYAGVLASLLEFFGRLSYHIGLNTVQMNRFVVRGKHCDESTFSYMTHNLLQSFEK